MAKFTVDTNSAVTYDGRMLYKRTAAYTVQDNYHNYLKSLKDVAAGLITVTEVFTNTISDTATLLQISKDVAGSSVNKNSSNYLVVEADLSSATWNTVATHKLFDITGAVRVRLWAECTVTGDDTTGNTSKIQLGLAGATTAFIGATDVDDLAAGELWYDTTPTTAYDTFANAVLDKIVVGTDIGYEITGEAAVAGKVKFHCVWEPLNATGTVVAGNGSAMA